MHRAGFLFLRFTRGGRALSSSAERCRLCGAIALVCRVAWPDRSYPGTEHEIVEIAALSVVCVV